MKVFVYYNLHKKLWSVKALEGPDKGRVIARKRVVHLRHCEFKVSQKGRERVLREQRKNVHAGVVGQYGRDFTGTSIPTTMTYNPYFYKHFVDKENFLPVEYAGQVLLTAEEDCKPTVNAWNVSYMD